MPIQDKLTFLSHMEAKLPNIVSHKRILDEIPYDDYDQLVFETKKPYTIDEVIDMFEHDAQLHLLYHHVNKDVKESENCCAFSHPIEDRMFKFNVHTNGDGKVTTLTVSIYKSIEIYTAELARELRKHAEKGTMKVAMDEGELYKHSLLFRS